MNEKWDAVFSDVEFAKSIISMEPEDALKALKEKGYDFSLEEVLEAGEEISQMMSQMNEELDEGALENVAGGAIGWNFKTGFVIGAVVAGGIICCGW